MLWKARARTNSAKVLAISPKTADPGEKGNCVIAGHRDTHFRVLKDIRKGDDITIETRMDYFSTA